jgi:hypothetical protein
MYQVNFLILIRNYCTRFTNQFYVRTVESNIFNIYLQIKFKQCRRSKTLTYEEVLSLL